MPATELKDQPKPAVEESENEFISLLSKRLKKQKKKLANITEIEVKVRGGSKINADQQQALDSKDGVAKSIAELEGLRLEYIKLHQQNEKLQTRLKKKNAADVEAEKQRDRLETVRRITELFQAADLPQFDGKVRHLVKLVLTDDQSAGVQHALKYLACSEEVVAPGTTYKTIHEQVSKYFTPSPVPAIPAEATNAQESVVEPAEPEATVQAQPTVEPAVSANVQQTSADNLDTPAATSSDLLAEPTPSAVGEWGATSVDESPVDSAGWSDTPSGDNRSREFTEQRRGGRRGGRGGEGRGRGGRGRGEYRGEYRGGRGEYRGSRGGFRGDTRGGDNRRGRDSAAR